MIRIGRLVATHGLNGAIVLTHVMGDGKWLKKELPLMVEINKGSFIPYFLRDFKLHGDEEAVIFFEEVDTVDAAKRLVQKNIYLDQEELKEYVKKSPLLWIGFNVVDAKLGSLGPMVDVLESAGHWLGKIMYNGNEALIPLVNPVLIEVNARNKWIRVDLPDGLLEIYS